MYCCLVSNLYPLRELVDTLFNSRKKSVTNKFSSEPKRRDESKP